jgi:hypothetical protein
VNLKELMAKDGALFLNESEFADRATYNNVLISVVAELGPDRTSGNTFTNTGQSNLAVFWVSESDVLCPDQGDILVYRDTVWRVARILESGGGIHKIECTAQEAVGW